MIKNWIHNYYFSIVPVMQLNLVKRSWVNRKFGDLAILNNPTNNTLQLKFHNRIKLCKLILEIGENYTFFNRVLITSIIQDQDLVLKVSNLIQLFVCFNELSSFRCGAVLSFIFLPKGYWGSIILRLIIIRSLTFFAPAMIIKPENGRPVNIVPPFERTVFH